MSRLPDRAAPPGPDPIFVGLDNFSIRLPADATFLASIPRTIIFAAGTTLVTIPLAIAAAMVMNRSSRFAPVIGIVLLLPWAIAPVVSGFYWRFIFQPTFGVSTNILNALGLADGTIPWLQSGESAMVIAILATAWRVVPLFALVLLAGFKTIPEAHYRAARMDGAGPWQSFRYITLPAIRPLLLITTVLAIITSLQIFDAIFQLTKGGPGFETTTMTYYIFEAAINQLSLGYSSALALLLLAVIVVFSVLAFALRGRRQKERIDQEDLTETGDRGMRRIRAGSAPAGATVAPAVAGRADSWRYEDDSTAAGRSSIFRLPPRVLQALFAIAAGLLIVWSVFPTLWILIASIQPEGAVTSIPLALSLMPDLDHFRTLLADLAGRAPSFVSLAVSLGATALTLLLGALAAYPLARLAATRQGHLPRRVDLHPDGPRDRPWHPGPAHLREPGTQGHHPRARPGQHGLPVAACRLAAAERLHGGAASRSNPRLGSMALAARNALPGHYPGRLGRHRRNGDPAAHQHLERVPVRGDPGRHRGGDRDPADRVHRFSDERLRASLRTRSRQPPGSWRSLPCVVLSSCSTAGSEPASRRAYVKG